MNNKRGQFYIIAAVVIILVIAGIVGVKNYVSVQSKPRTVQSMASELKEESFKIVDYGIYNDQNLTEIMNNFVDNYSQYFMQRTNSANIIFVYGNRTNLNAAKYDEANSGKVTANIGSSSAGVWTNADFVNRTSIIVNPSDNAINVTIFNKPYNFTLKDNEMFYFVIVQEKEGEVYVEENK